MAAGLALAALAHAYVVRDDEAAGRRLVSALLAGRFTAGRLAGQTVWEPCAAVDTATLVPRVRCGEPLRPGTRRFRRIHDAERAVGRSPGADTSLDVLRGRALLDLLRDDSAASRRAADSLEQALRLAPADPAVLNDLAVAGLALGEQSQQLMPLLRALDAVERAFAADSLDAAVLFNRALVQQRLYMIESAKSAWTRYLAVERDPRWRAEAEEHARRAERAAAPPVSWEGLLDRPPERIDAAVRAAVARRVRRSPQAAREFCFGLLGGWGEAASGGDSTLAARRLALAREIGGAAVRQGLDKSVALAVASIDAAAGDARRTAALAEAHAELARGYTLFYQPDYREAAASLERAEGGLRAAGSPASRWAAFYRAAAEMYLEKGYHWVDGRWRAVLSEATADEPALVGRAIWALGVTQVRRGNYEDATRLYRKAVPHIERAAEPDNLGTLSYLQAESLGLAGQTPAGQAEALRGLRLLTPFRTSPHLNNHLSTVAAYARADALSHASLAIMGEVLAVSRSIGTADLLARAHRAHARDLLALGRREEARAELREGLRWADLLPDRTRDRVRADVVLVQGQLLRAEDPRAALHVLSDVVETYRKVKIDLHVPPALYEAALAAGAAGDTAGARARLHEAIEHIERQHASFDRIEVRATFHETVENVFDAVIRMELDAGRPAAAFEYLERARAAIQPLPGPRSIAAAGAAGGGIARIGASLPAGVLFADYALLPDRLVVWAASRRGWRHVSVPVRRDTVAALVERLRAELGEPDAAASPARARLFDLLVRPLARELAGARRLTVVPDRELNRLPFAALWDRRTGRYLMEDHPVTTVPSAAFHAAASSRAHGDRRRLSALVVGNPSLDAESARRLPPLPGAVREAERVAPMYERRRLLRGAEAGREAVLGLLPSYSVFHFAGHAVFNGEQPGSSYLALAPDGANGAGVLRAWEIGELRLSNVQMAVLSACSTLSPRPSRAGPAAGLAYSFLRAGVPATVSTLWDVKDDATTGLLVEFHRRFAGGASPAEALRQAQLGALQSGRPELRAPEAWAAFIYTGP